MTEPTWWALSTAIQVGQFVGIIWIRKRRWHPFRSQSAMLKAARADNRRFDRDRRTAFMRSLRAQGATTVAIGKIVGLDPASVSRYLLHGRNP